MSLVRLYAGMVGVLELSRKEKILEIFIQAGLEVRARKGRFFPIFFLWPIFVA